jgi:hypothetical protein
LFVVAWFVVGLLFVAAGPLFCVLVVVCFVVGCLLLWAAIHGSSPLPDLCQIMFFSISVKKS